MNVHPELRAPVPGDGDENECDDAEHDCDWQKDEDRKRLLQEREEQEALSRSRDPFDRDGRRFVTSEAEGR